MTVPDNPYTREEMYLSAIADGGSSGIPAVPYTRKERYLQGIAKGDSSGIPETPYTREEMYLDEIARNGGGGGGGGKSPTEILYNPDFKLNTTGQTFWDGSNTGTSETSRLRIIDGWEIMRCTAEVVSDGIKIVPAASSAYLTSVIPRYWFIDKSLTISVVVDDVEIVSTGTLQGYGNAALIDTTFGRFYIYTYTSGTCALTLAFDSQIGHTFVVSKSSVHLTNT